VELVRNPARAGISLCSINPTLTQSSRFKNNSPESYGASLHPGFGMKQGVRDIAENVGRHPKIFLLFGENRI
jgi:hypothetical protein